MDDLPPNMNTHTTANTDQTYTDHTVNTITSTNTSATATANTSATATANTSTSTADTLGANAASHRHSSADLIRQRHHQLMRRPPRAHSHHFHPDHAPTYHQHHHQHHQHHHHQNQHQDDLVLTEDMSLKERQDAINASHPFGLRLWKSSLYKKHRRIDVQSHHDIHQHPSDTGTPQDTLSDNTHDNNHHDNNNSNFRMAIGNWCWALVFGWWMAVVYAVLALVLMVITGSVKHSRFLLQMAEYVLWPFGRFIATTSNVSSSFFPGDSHNDNTNDHDDNDDDVTEPLLPRHSIFTSPAAQTRPRRKRSNVAAIASSWASVWYHVFYALVLVPMHMFVSCLCWFGIFSIPMAKLNYVLLSRILFRPIASGIVVSNLSLFPSSSSTTSGEILLCTFRATGREYIKYTVDGVNIFFLNLIPIVLFSLLDGYYLAPLLHHTGIGHPMVVFVLCLISVIPLAYYIGMAVASISSQTSYGMGAVINATFGSIVEVILYWLAITQSKGLLVEGAIIGSFLGTLLLLPGLSMIMGGMRFKEQRFNVKSAGVSTVLLIMALIGAFTPTLFYAMFAKYTLKCDQCPSPSSPSSPSSSSSGDSHSNSLNPVSMVMACTGCSYELPDPGSDPFYVSKTRPLMYLCAGVLLFSYLIGLWFTLRTHVKQIYHTPTISNAHGTSVGVGRSGNDEKREEGEERPVSTLVGALVLSPPPGKMEDKAVETIEEVSESSSSSSSSSSSESSSETNEDPQNTLRIDTSSSHVTDSIPKSSHHGNGEEGHGGHDAPEWSTQKSTIILLIATILFSLLAEILVDAVDEVIHGSSISLKFLGLTLFAIVPNVTEFVNAVGFASVGNIALSLEIGSAYASQVALLQIPFLVIGSGVYNAWKGMPDTQERSFTLMFPKWDVYTVFASVFLLSYTYIEGKANYFKGTILCLAYFVLVASFYFSDEV